MKPFILPWAVLLALAACAPQPRQPSQAQTQTPPAVKATVTMVIGDAGVLRANEPGRKPLRTGDSLKPEDVILTSADATVTILLEKTGLMRIGPNSRVILSSLLLNPDGNFDQRIAVRQGRVTLGLNKLRRESSFRVEAPTAVAGVRGTSFVVDVQDPGGHAFPYFVRTDRRDVKVRVAVFSGSVEMSSPASPQTVTVEPMKMAVLDGDNFADIKIVPIERLYLGELEELRRMSELRSVDLSELSSELDTTSPTPEPSVNRRLDIRTETKKATAPDREETRLQDTPAEEPKVERVRTERKREGKYLEAGEGW